MKTIQDLLAQPRLVAITLVRYPKEGEDKLDDTYMMHLESMSNIDTISAQIEIPKDVIHMYDWNCTSDELTSWIDEAEAGGTKYA